MNTKTKTLATAVLPVFLVAACGGGGDGGNGNTAFTSFEDVPSNGTTTLDGTAVTADFASNGAGIDVTNQSGRTDSTARIYNEDGSLVALTVRAPGSSAKIDSREGGTFTPDGDYTRGRSQNGQESTVFADPEQSGFNYQTYGVWIQGDPSSSGSYGVASYGNRTGSTPAPVNNNATYSGGAIGVYTFANSNSSGIVTSDATVSTDFATASIQTTNSQIAYFDENRPDRDVPALNMTGTATVASDGSFAGAISSPLTSGTVEGDFYGGNAQEVGGTFVASGNSGRTFNGSFGAAR